MFHLVCEMEGCTVGIFPGKEEVSGVKGHPQIIRHPEKGVQLCGVVAKGTGIVKILQNDLITLCRHAVGESDDPAAGVSPVSLINRLFGYQSRDQKDLFDTVLLHEGLCLLFKFGLSSPGVVDVGNGA